MKNLLIFFTITLSTFTFSTQAIASERLTYSTSVHGTSTPVPLSTVVRLCGDIDGCTLRMGMFNWDGTRRTASRESLFYYDSSRRTWRASRSDKAGTNNNNVTEHVMEAWTCYFTDGRYRGFGNAGDYDNNFAVLAWRSYPRSTCRVTIVD